MAAMTVKIGYCHSTEPHKDRRHRAEEAVALADALCAALAKQRA
jgi:hypothetical protein